MTPAKRIPLRPCLLSLLMLSACQSPAGSGDAVDSTEPGALRVSIGQVQGIGERSTYVGQRVSVEGVVVGNFSQGLGGVFIQSLTADDNAQSSEGLFVELAVEPSPEAGGDADPRLRRGDRVRATGTVSESGRDDDATLTALADAQIEVLGRSEITAQRIEAAPEPAEWERFEGMLLQIQAPLTVSGTPTLARYGEIIASFGGRLMQPTELASPGPAARKIAADNARRRLLLDDARRSENPKKLWFLADGLSDTATLRTGSVLREVTGILDQRHGSYRLQLTDPLTIEHAPRPPAPSVPGDLRIASFNLHNFFNGDGAGGGYPTPRGAETAAQQQVQLRKLVAMVQALQPDVAALMEVENDGYGPESALAQFVLALNQAGPVRDYRFVDAGTGPGDDQIKVALIYRGNRVSPQGRPAMLTGGSFTRRSRVPLAQAFRAGKGPVFVAVANHFKSKGCGRDAEAASGADADQGDGQSCWNPVRVESARALNAWLASDPTGSRSELRLIIGDFNAYAQEDPLRLLRDAGWQDAFAVAKAQGAYSFVFEGQAGRLDHALLSPALATRLRGASEWHNNADEADFFEAADGQPWRASDHDPLLLGFDLGR